MAEYFTASQGAALSSSSRGDKPFPLLSSSVLQHELFRNRLKDWLKTMRRKNAVVVMAPQQISDIANSQIADVVLENCPTKILLPNAESKNPGSREFYTRVGLNERELEILQVSIPKQHYYIVSKLGRRLVNLGIGKIALSWVGVNGREERQIVESVMEPRIGKHSVRVGTNDDETASENNHPVHCAVADVLRVYEAGASRRDRRNRGGSRFGRFVFNTCSAD